MTTADLLRAIQHRTALCRELWITPVTLYRCVWPQGQVREQGEKIRSSPLNRSAWTVIPLGTFWKQRLTTASALARVSQTTGYDTC